jgi:hypothetical protein
MVIEIHLEVDRHLLKYGRGVYEEVASAVHQNKYISVASITFSCGDYG